MAVRFVTVTSSAKNVPGSNPGGFQDDTTITNTGSATVYVDSDQPETTTAGQPITAGSSVIWEKGQPLWVVCPTSSTLTLSQNAGGVFDAGAIASQIIAQGLTATAIATAITGGVTLSPSAIASAITGGAVLSPANIATQITGGTTLSPANIASAITGGVTLSPSAIASAITGGVTLSPAAIASQINLAGVPAIEQSAFLYNNTAGFNVNGNTGMNNQGPFDVTKYQSVRLWAQEFHTLAATTNIRRIDLLWWLNAGGTIQIAQDSVDVPSGQIVAAFPCRGPYLSLAFNTIPVQSTTLQALAGSYRPAARAEYKVITNDLTGASGFLGSEYGIDGIFSISSNTIPTNATTFEYPCTSAGPALFSGDFASIPNGSINLRVTLQTGLIIASIMLPTSATRTVFTQQVVLPFGPVRVQISPTTGATAQMNVNLSLNTVGF